MCVCCAFRKIPSGTFPPVFFFSRSPPLPLSYPRGKGDRDRFPQKIYLPPRGELRGYYQCGTTVIDVSEEESSRLRKKELFFSSSPRHSVEHVQTAEIPSELLISKLWNVRVSKFQISKDKLLHVNRRYVRVCVYECLVITYYRVWINRVRLPIILLVVS